MKNVSLLSSHLCLVLLIFAACSSESNPEPNVQLESMSFEGSLPDGSEFGESDIRSANGVTVSGMNQKYNGSHILSIRSFETGWSLSLETPRLEFDEMPPMDESDGSALTDFFKENYPYEILLEKLLIEKQKADVDPNYNGIENVRIVLTKEDEYYAYLPDESALGGFGRVRILEVKEGIQKNIQGQDIRKIEVLVEMDLNLKASNSNVQPQQGVLLATAKFKYREDFYQGEFEQ